MKKLILPVLFTSAIFVSCNEEIKQQKTKVNYPLTTKKAVIDTLFGTEVVDNYRWLEDDRSKMIAPILEELSEAYGDKITIYKIDTEAEQELAAAFAIKSIPSMLFCPMEGPPQMANGALPKAELERIIATVLCVEK